MLSFIKPELLNGSQLVNELNNANIKVKGLPFLDGENVLWLDLSEKDYSKAKEIVAVHIGQDETLIIEAKKEAILEKIGISKEELAFVLS
jgi:hypothetical protein